MKRSMLFALLLALSACASRASPGTSSEEVASLRQDLVKLQDSVDQFQNQLGHLQSNVDAASADNEFTDFGIDEVVWGNASARFDQLMVEQLELSSMGQSPNREFERELAASRPPVLLCHPTEWRGWGKIIRFARLADPVVNLEAEGHPSIAGRMQCGGVCNSDGSLRFVFLELDKTIEPGVEYRVRPRNENEHYRWTVGDGVTVAAR